MTYYISLCYITHLHGLDGREMRRPPVAASDKTVEVKRILSQR